MKNNIKKRAEGFTIIEVLIVLAIAGLILLIVFLAVPALQRNGRNTTKRSDASKVLGAVGEFISNNNGALPTTTASIETAANLSSGTTILSISTSAAIVSGGQIQVVTSATCSGTNATSTATTTLTLPQFAAAITTNTNTRSYLVLYTIETVGGLQRTQCVGS